MVRVPALVLPLAVLSGCFLGDENIWANEAQIMASAKRCGVQGLKPTKADQVWAAYVPAAVPDHARKEDCIYKDLAAQNLLATR